MCKTVVLRLPKQGFVSFKIEDASDYRIISSNSTGKFKEIGRSNESFNEVLNIYTSDLRFHQLINS